MTNIEPVDQSVAEAQGLGSLLEKTAAWGDDEATFLRILAHVPRYAAALGDAMAQSHLDGNVDHSLKEIMRIQLARLAGDDYFAGLRSSLAANAGLTEDRIEDGVSRFEGNPNFTDAERWALRYAHEMYRNPQQVDKSFYDEGKKHFSEAEIMEMGGMIAIHYGMQVFMRTLQQ